MRWTAWSICHAFKISESIPKFKDSSKELCTWIYCLASVELPWLTSTLGSHSEGFLRPPHLATVKMLEMLFLTESTLRTLRRNVFLLIIPGTVLLLLSSQSVSILYTAWIVELLSFHFSGWFCDKWAKSVARLVCFLMFVSFLAPFYISAAVFLSPLCQIYVILLHFMYLYKLPEILKKKIR